MLKPWEVSSMNNSGVTLSTGNKPYVSNTDRLQSNPIPFPGSGGGSVSTCAQPMNNTCPPVPPRPAQVRPVYSAYDRSSMMPYSSPYSNYTSPYSGMGISPYGGMGMGAYGPSSYGMGMSPYGRGMYGSPYGGQPAMEPSFTQMAEESAASAFQSIQSFVNAFGSISAMLDSTFHALYSSFTAVVGVADHLGRVKQILSALAVFRFFKWVYRRFLYLVGISKIKPADIESLWDNISSNDSGQIMDIGESLLKPGSPKSSSWPIIMFLGFIFAGPYLMWKLIKSLNLDPSQKLDDRKWASGESEHFVATAEYAFEPMNDRELPVKPGQTIRLAPAKFQPPNVKGWVLASDGVKIGLIPTNYIKVMGKRSRDVQQLHVPAQPQQPTIPLPFANNAVLHPHTNSTQMGVDDSLSESKQQFSLVNSDSSLDLSNFQADTAGMSSDDDSETLVGDPLGD